MNTPPVITRHNQSRHSLLRAVLHGVEPDSGDDDDDDDDETRAAANLPGCACSPPTRAPPPHSRIVSFFDHPVSLTRTSMAGESLAPLHTPCSPPQPYTPSTPLQPTPPSQTISRPSLSPHMVRPQPACQPSLTPRQVSQPTSFTHTCTQTMSVLITLLTPLSHPLAEHRELPPDPLSPGRPLRRQALPPSPEPQQVLRLRPGPLHLLCRTCRSLRGLPQSQVVHH